MAEERWKLRALHAKTLSEQDRTCSRGEKKRFLLLFLSSSILSHYDIQVSFCRWTTHTIWQRSAYTRGVGRCSLMPKNHACTILGRQCSTRGRKVGTLVLAYFYFYFLFNFDVFVETMDLLQLAELVLMDRLEMLQAPRPDLRGVHGHPTMHNRQTFNSR